MHIIKNSIVAILLVILLQSCGSESPFPERDVDLLFPVINSNIGPNSVPEFTNKLKFSDQIFTIGNPAFNNGTTNAFVNDVNFGNNIVIYDDNSFSNDFSYMKMNSVTMLLTLTNTLPITVKAGTILKFYSVETSQTDILLFTHTLDSDLVGGQSLTIEKSLDPTTNSGGIILKNKIKVVLDNFTTKGTGGSVTLTNTTKLKISLQLKNVDIDRILVYKKKFFINDTVDFNFDPQNSINKSTITGRLILYNLNNMPADYKFQLITLDSITNNANDSIYIPNALNLRGVKLNTDGTTLDFNTRNNNTPNITEIDTLTGIRFSRMMNSKKVIIRASIDNITNTANVSNSVIEFTNKSFAKFQVVADIKAKVK